MMPAKAVRALRALPRLVTPRALRVCLFAGLACLAISSLVLASVVMKPQPQQPKVQPPTFRTVLQRQASWLCDGVWSSTPAGELAFVGTSGRVLAASAPVARSLRDLAPNDELVRGYSMWCGGQAAYVLYLRSGTRLRVGLSPDATVVSYSGRPWPNCTATPSFSLTQSRSAGDVDGGGGAAALVVPRGKQLAPAHPFCIVRVLVVALPPLALVDAEAVVQSLRTLRHSLLEAGVLDEHVRVVVTLPPSQAADEVPASVRAALRELADTALNLVFVVSPHGAPVTPAAASFLADTLRRLSLPDNAALVWVPATTQVLPAFWATCTAASHAEQAAFMGVPLSRLPQHEPLPAPAQQTSAPEWARAGVLCTTLPLLNELARCRPRGAPPAPAPAPAPPAAQAHGNAAADGEAATPRAWGTAGDCSLLLRAVDLRVRTLIAPPAPHAQRLQRRVWDAALGPRRRSTAPSSPLGKLAQLWQRLRGAEAEAEADGGVGAVGAVGEEEAAEESAAAAAAGLGGERGIPGVVVARAAPAASRLCVAVRSSSGALHARDAARRTWAASADASVSVVFFVGSAACTDVSGNSEDGGERGAGACDGSAVVADADRGDVVLLPLNEADRRFPTLAARLIFDWYLSNRRDCAYVTYGVDGTLVHLPALQAALAEHRAAAAVQQAPPSLFAGHVVSGRPLADMAGVLPGALPYDPVPPFAAAAPSFTVSRDLLLPLAECDVFESVWSEDVATAVCLRLRGVQPAAQAWVLSAPPCNDARLVSVHAGPAERVAECWAQLQGSGQLRGATL